MADGVPVAKTTDIPRSDCLCVDFEGERVVIWNVEGDFYAMSEECPHAGGPLSEAHIEDGKVMCPWHGWAFDLDPSVKEPPNDMLCRYRVTVEGEDISLEKMS